MNEVVRGGAWYAVFDWCADSLQWLAKKISPFVPGGMDYVKINVIIFCIVVPAILLASLALNILLLLR